jgi:hypothetical protein
MTSSAKSTQTTTPFSPPEVKITDEGGVCPLHVTGNTVAGGP